MAEQIFDCSLDKFNKKVSKYLSNIFGSPLINRSEKTEKFEGFTYNSSPADNIKVNVGFSPNYSAKDGRYLLENKVQISFNTGYQHIHSRIIKKLEKMCK